MVDIPHLTGLSVSEWQNFLDYLSARLRDCGQMYITDVQFKSPSVRELFLQLFAQDIVSAFASCESSLIDIKADAVHGYSFSSVARLFKHDHITPLPSAARPLGRQ
jgi:hypothetical protein